MTPVKELTMTNNAGLFLAREHIDQSEPIEAPSPGEYDEIIKELTIYFTKPPFNLNWGEAEPVALRHSELSGITKVPRDQWYKARCREAGVEWNGGDFQVSHAPLRRWRKMVTEPMC